MPKASGFGHGMCQKTAMRASGRTSFSRRGSRGEVIILDQHAGFLNIMQFVHNGRGEFAVCALILRPVILPENGPGVGNVAEGPQAFVGETVIVAVLLLFGQRHPSQRVAGIVGRHPDPSLRIHHLPIGVACAVGNPGAARSSQHRLQRRHQTSGWNDALHLPAAPHVHIGFPVGDHEKRSAVQFRLYVLAKTLRRPQRFRRLAQAGLFPRGRFGVGQVSGKRRHLLGNGTEEVSLGYRGRLDFLARSKLLHP